MELPAGRNELLGTSRTHLGGTAKEAKLLRTLFLQFLTMLRTRLLLESIAKRVLDFGWMRNRETVGGFCNCSADGMYRHAVE